LEVTGCSQTIVIVFSFLLSCDKDLGGPDTFENKHNSNTVRDCTAKWLRQFLPKNPVSYTLIELGPPHDFELSAIQVEGQVSFTDCVPNELAHRHCFPS
jgi:hypothetical protein